MIGATTILTRRGNKLLGNISNNVNQIAKKANTYGSVYAEDLAKIEAGQEQIWEAQKKILRRLSDLLEFMEHSRKRR